jgi:UDP-glucuronate 4-epimerase
MAHYLVTGAAGFIAAQTATQLLAAGHTVVGIDDMNDYYDPRLKQWRVDQLKGQTGFEFRRIDITNLNELLPVFEANRFDAVINLAARAGVRYSMKNPWVYFQTNVMGNLNLLEQCKDHGIKKYVFASTSSLYAGLPMPFSESTPTMTPISPYAASKGSAEMTCYTYHRLYDIDISVVRYFTVYGPAGRPDMSPFRFIRWIDEGSELVLYGDGTQSRDFTYVDDIARGTIAALKPVGYEIINLGNNRPHRLIEAIHLMERYLGKEAKIKYLPFQPTDMKDTWADVEKAKRLLGWEPTVSLEVGLRQTVAWYRANQDWVRQIQIDLSI